MDRKKELFDRIGTLSYRCVPKPIINACLAASLIFGALFVFQLLPLDERIAPPELHYSPYAARVNGIVDPASRGLTDVTTFNQGLIGDFCGWLQSRMSFASDEEIARLQAEESLRRQTLNETRDDMRPATALEIREAQRDPEIIFRENIEKLIFKRHMILCVFALLSVLCAFLAMRLKDAKLCLDSSGLKFPPGMMPSLDWRRLRPWTDLSAINFRGNTKNSDAAAIELYFSSGGKANILVNRLSQKDREQFFLALDGYAGQALRSPELVLFRHEVFGSKSKDPSFTQLWEEELHSHFASTNFVALSPDSKVQNGRIKVLMHISSGGLSAVYLAEQGSRMFVLKESVIPPGTSEQNRQKARDMFSREASMLMQLEHAQIAKVIDYFQENDRDYLLLEYIPGITLREYLRRHGPQNEQRVLQWGGQIASILQYLHDRNPPVVHRDLTPDNLMLTPSGEIVLIDFGAANQFIGTATGTIVGKQFYISPEQFRGKAEPASDIYSLGATMHFLLTGCEPEALAVSSPRKVLASISGELDTLVSDCTALKSENRIPSAAALLERITRIEAAFQGGFSFEDDGVILSCKQGEKEAL